MNIFVTGESGTIPLAIQRIANEDFSIFDVVNSQISNKNLYSQWLKQFKKHQSFKCREPELDFLDKDLLRSKQFIRMWEETDVIIHSGAYVGTDFCGANPKKCIETNVTGTHNIVQLCNDFGIKLVYFSTTAIFDPKDYSEDKLMTENTKINPQTLYGITKAAGEQIVEKLCKTDKIIIRPVFGFSDYPDDLHSAMTKLIYKTLLYDKFYMGNDKLKILLNPAIKKSYTRVENIAECVLKIIQNGYWNEVFNVGTHERYDWDEYIEMIGKILSWEYNYYDGVKFIQDRIKQRVEFIPQEDYLHWHTIDNSKVVRYGVNTFDIPVKEGIKKTIFSVFKNMQITPYWI